MVIGTVEGSLGESTVERKHHPVLGLRLSIRLLCANSIGQKLDSRPICLGGGWYIRGPRLNADSTQFWSYACRYRPFYVNSTGQKLNSGPIFSAVVGAVEESLGEATVERKLSGLFWTRAR